MARIPWAYSDGQLTVEVELQHAANVFLVDETNFRKYKAGRSFKYYGGHYNRSPVTITVNSFGRFYLVVENGGRYRYSFY